jgi:hypothetical protein
MAKQLPSGLVRELESADLILHAGDWTSEEVYESLSRYAPTEGVAGNNDGEAIIRKFGYRKKLQCENVTIGIVHGHSFIAGRTALQEALSAFAPDEVDVIVFGHSHIPYNEKHGNILLFNPGSPTDKRRQPRYSFGIMEISGSRIKAWHVYDDKKE